MPITTEIVNYSDGNTGLLGFLARDADRSEPLPAVLIAPTWAGRSEFVEQQARRLASLGYVGFAVDIYGGGKCGASQEENAALMQPFIEDRELLRCRILAALDAIKAQPGVDAGRVAAIGYCFGGLTVLDLARADADIRGVVSFHGLLVPPAIESPAKIHSRVLVLHGDLDPLAPPDHVLAFKEEMTAKQADWQFHAFGHAVHAFTNPMASDPASGMVYNAAADARSWALMKSFLCECFDVTGDYSCGE